MALIGGSMSVNAQKTWNFSTWEARDYTTTETIEDLTVVATSDKKIVIDGSNKTINDVNTHSVLSSAEAVLKTHAMSTFKSTGHAQ